jgi:hypothetical protein
VCGLNGKEVSNRERERERESRHSHSLLFLDLVHVLKFLRLLRHGVSVAFFRKEAPNPVDSIARDILSLAQYKGFNVLGATYVQREAEFSSETS